MDELRFFDIDGPLSSIQECDICGSSDFHCQDGFYYCNVCCTQSQNTQEIVLEKKLGGNDATFVRSALLRDAPGDSVKDKKCRRKLNLKSCKNGYFSLSMYEVYNVSLKTLCDQLISLGYPPLLKSKVFELWTNYLIHHEVIFVSKRSTKKPHRLSHCEATTTVASLYGKRVPYRPNVSNQVNSLFRKEKRLKKKTHESKSVAKRKQTILKRKAIEKEYLENVEKDMEAENENCILPDEGPFLPDSQTSEVVKMVKKQKRNEPTERKKSLSEMMKDLHKGIVMTSTSKKLKKKRDTVPKYTKDGKIRLLSNRSDIGQIEKFRVSYIYFLLYIALREIGCPVFFSDVYRLVREGLLDRTRVKKAYDEDLSSSGFALFLNSPYLNLVPLHYFIDILDLIPYMGIDEKKFSHPRLLQILPRFMDELKLPREVECLINEMEGLMPWEKFIFFLKSRTLGRRLKVFNEMCAVYVVIMVMKMLFGLDDVTEQFQARAAKVINSCLSKMKKNLYNAEAAPKSVLCNAKGYVKSHEDWLRLFNFNSWARSMIFRNNLKRHELCSSYQPYDVKMNMRAMTGLVNDYGGRRFWLLSTNLEPRQTAFEKMKTMISDILEEQLGTENNRKIDPYNTVELGAESLAKEYVARVTVAGGEANVNYPEFKHGLKNLTNNFSKCRVDFITNPKAYAAVLDHFGYKLRVVKGSASNYKKSRVMRWWSEKKIVTIFQPFRHFDEHISQELKHQSHSVRLLLKVVSDNLPLGAGFMEKEIPSLYTKYLYEAFNSVAGKYCQNCFNGSICLKRDGNIDGVDLNLVPMYEPESYPRKNLKRDEEANGHFERRLMSETDLINAQFNPVPRAVYEKDPKSVGSTPNPPAAPHVANPRVKCPECPKTFPSRTFKRHLIKHARKLIVRDGIVQTVFKCFICSEIADETNTFETRQEIFHHLTHVH